MNDKDNNKSSDFLEQSKKASRKSPSKYNKSVNASVHFSGKDIIKESTKDELKHPNISHLFRKKSNKSQSIKDLSSLDYIRYKKELSKIREEFFDMGGRVYKNYKYEKLKLQRPELTFILHKPLDFCKKSLVFDCDKEITE